MAYYIKEGLQQMKDKQLCKTAQRLRDLGRTQAENMDYIGDPNKEKWQSFLYSVWDKDLIVIKE